MLRAPSDLLKYFAFINSPFMMECCERTEADKKGGHLARRTADGQLVLRESAQCAKEDAEVQYIRARLQLIMQLMYLSLSNVCGTILSFSAL